MNPSEINKNLIKTKGIARIISLVNRCKLVQYEN